MPPPPPSPAVLPERRLPPLTLSVPVLKMPPPALPAELAARVVLLTVRVAPRMLLTPPPEPGPGAALPERVHPLGGRARGLRVPPPPLALPPWTVRPLMVAVTPGLTEKTRLAPWALTLRLPGPGPARFTARVRVSWPPAPREIVPWAL